MAVDSKHPEYSARLPDWTQMGDCYAGERVIKGKGITYLPPTEGMVIDGMGNADADGQKAYEAYLMRAVYPDFVKEGISAMVGIMHREPYRVELPPEMEPLRKKLTANGEDMETFLRKLNEAQLLHGRAGFLVEAPDGPGLPFIALFSAQRIINWDDGTLMQGVQSLEFVVIDESNDVRTNSFDWKFENSFRVCAMSSAIESLSNVENTAPPAQGIYQVAVVGTIQGNDIGPETVWKTPAVAGKELDFIPFVFVNTKDLVPSPDAPPLLGLSNLCLSIYRGEADYRQDLHMQGQDTLVTVGADTKPGDKTRIGAGASINLPRDCDAKFIGVSADGLQAQREALDADKALAGELTSRLFDSTGTSYQSGEALRIRVSAKTATLKTIAETSAAALKQGLVIIANWIGADASKIVVEPNTDFVDTSAASRTSLELAQAAQMGFPISHKSMHRFAVQQGLTVLTFEQEQSEIEAQPPIVPTAGLAGQAGGILGKSTGGSRVARGVDDKPESKAPSK